MTWRTDAEDGSERAQVRMRLSHSRTQKDGWRFESTVELLHWEDMPLIADVMRMYLEQADALGRAESARRNALDAREVGP